MGITNRSKDVSEQKDVYSWINNTLGATTVNTGATGWIGMIPYAGVIQSMRSAAVGLSGAMAVDLFVLRGGSGGTAIAVSISAMILREIGATGVVGYSGLAASGSTLLQVQAGDVLQFKTSVANTAAMAMLLQVVVKKTQDVVAYHGNPL